MIWSMYKYLYYRLYRWNKKVWGKDDIPEYNAMIMVALLSFINIFSIPFLVEAISGIRILELPKLSKGAFFLFFLCFVSIHYFLLVHKGKYLNFEKEFKSETNDNIRKGGYLIVFYIIASISVLFGSWYLIYLRSDSSSLLTF